MGKKKDFDRIDYWTDLHLECYCLLNLDYIRVKDKYCYQLVDGGIDKAKKVPNPEYDPNIKPHVFPKGCKKKINIECLECPYVGYVGMDVMEMEE